MLPRANRERSRRDVSKLKLSGRSAEIQRLVGRSLRAAIDMEKLGERTITVDCDVIQGDGGTRTASVTGGFIALALACRKLVEDGVLGSSPIRYYVTGVSAGIVEDTALLDLQYYEDSRAQVDLNCVMNEMGELIELQVRVMIIGKKKMHYMLEDMRDSRAKLQRLFTFYQVMLPASVRVDTIWSMVA